MSEQKDDMPLSKESSPASQEGVDGEQPASKRVCTGTSLRNATRIIKVEVGGGQDTEPAAEWMFHENLLIANSELAKGCLAHETSETVNDTIKLVQADAEAFEVFADYVYKGRLQHAKLTLDQLLKVYILADYLGSPKMADVVFEQIFHRTQSPSFVFTYPQIDYVLSNTLEVQPLRILLLDKVGCGVLRKLYDFSGEPADVLEPYIRELMNAVVKANATSTTPTPCFPILDLAHYLKHEVGESTDNVDDAQLPASTAPDDQIACTLGNMQIDYVIGQTKVTRARAITALKVAGGNPGGAIKWMKANPESTPSASGGGTALFSPAFTPTPTPGLFGTTHPSTSFLGRF